MTLSSMAQDLKTAAADNPLLTMATLGKAAAALFAAVAVPGLFGFLTWTSTTLTSVQGEVQLIKQAIQYQEKIGDERRDSRDARLDEVSEDLKRAAEAIEKLRLDMERDRARR